METLYFPGLNFGVELHPVAFSIGSIDIYWYGIIIALGFLAALIYCMLRIKEFGLNGDRVIDVVIGGVLGGIVGGRLYYVFCNWDVYSKDFLSIFKTWEGGMAIYGSVIGAFLVGALVCKWRKLPILPVFDFAACGLLIGQAVGRWGNFINVEAFGSNTDLPWGMTSSSIARYLAANKDALARLGVVIDNTAPVHPTFFYESMWCLLGFILLAIYTKRRRFDGELFLMYVAWYGIGRSFIEGLRTDSLLIGTLRISQVLAIISAVTAMAVIAVVRSRIRRRNDPDYLPLYVDTDASKNFEANLQAQAERRRARKASRKDDLVRAEELYQRKKLEKAELVRQKREAIRAERDADAELEDEEEVNADEESQEAKNDGIGIETGEDAPAETDVGAAVPDEAEVDSEAVTGEDHTDADSGDNTKE